MSPDCAVLIRSAHGEIAMNSSLTPPFRADHVGSLLRPPELLRARDEHRAGRLSAVQLRRAGTRRSAMRR
jgi:hypothetical protein